MTKTSATSSPTSSRRRSPIPASGSRGSGCETAGSRIVRGRPRGFSATSGIAPSGVIPTTRIPSQGWNRYGASSASTAAFRFIEASVATRCPPPRSSKGLARLPGATTDRAAGASGLLDERLLALPRALEPPRVALAERRVLGDPAEPTAEVRDRLLVAAPAGIRPQRREQALAVHVLGALEVALGRVEVRLLRVPDPDPPGVAGGLERLRSGVDERFSRRVGLGLGPRLHEDDAIPVR